MLQAPRPEETTAAWRARFRWSVPPRINIAHQTVGRWAAETPDRTALVHVDENGGRQVFSFADLDRQAARLAAGLLHLGVQPGDRVGICLSQSPEAALAHLAVYRIGAIALPLFTLFGPEALAFRLADSGARAVVVDPGRVEALMSVRADCPDLAHVIVTGPEPVAAGTTAFARLLRDATGALPGILDTAADDPAVIIYTSGTTGNPKGALHAHRVLTGHLPGVQMPHDFPPQAGDMFWTPADWAWIGGLLDVLLPAWAMGLPVLSQRMRKFDPEAAFRLMAAERVRNVFLPPTALKLMRGVSRAAVPADLALRSVGSGGESLGSELLDWGRDTFGVPINEFYGQTECNLVVSCNQRIEPSPPGAMGRAVPGHDVAIVDEDGQPVPDGMAGEIAVAAPDPVMFLRYWNNPAATEAKFRADRLLTGDMGRRDAQGLFHFMGRADDVITSGGYRIGPGEIEDCLIRHPAVAMAAVIGKPDALRTEIVKAFVVPAAGVEPSDDLARQLGQHVRDRLAAHEYPREIAFVAELPMTATGKIMRRVLKDREARKGD
ncbi:acyl-CoA synthetase [Tistrella bauzanensis]|uniref:acyl-CoA synthetase n=1 Tax=Tistrella TaxID=171436 RepID=UPI0031F62341